MTPRFIVVTRLSALENSVPDPEPPELPDDEEEDDEEEDEGDP